MRRQITHDKCRFSKAEILRPGLKLIGAKTKTRDILYRLFPEHEVYFEPFLGTGAVLVGKTRVETEIVGDVNSFLIRYYESVKSDASKFFNEMWSLHEQLQSATEKKTFFESLKKEVSQVNFFCWMLRSPWFRNLIHQRMELGLIFLGLVYWQTVEGMRRQSALFYLIVKYGFNGLWRVNKKGECNVAWGKEETGRGIFNFEWLLRIAKRVQGVEFRNEPFQRLLFDAQIAAHQGKDVFVFLDPPYHDCRTVYNGEKWGIAEFEMLALLLKRAKFKWMLTINHHPFILSLFKDFPSLDNEVFYSCSQTAGGRGKKRELIIANFPLSLEPESVAEKCSHEKTKVLAKHLFMRRVECVNCQTKWNEEIA